MAVFFSLRFFLFESLHIGDTPSGTTVDDVLKKLAGALEQLKKTLRETDSPLDRTAEHDQASHHATSVVAWGTA